MAVLTLILKIISIILLVLLFLLLYFLVTPFRYKLKISSHDDFDLTGKVFTFLGLISVLAHYNKGLEIKLCLFWGLIRINLAKHKTDEYEDENEIKEKPQKKKKKTLDKEFLVRLIYAIPDFIKSLHIGIENAVFDFSTGEADKTGAALGYISMIPSAHSESCRIYGDFESEEAYFNGDIKIKGHVFLFTLLAILVKIKK
ncbi:MAG: hypothetical protein HUJ63_08815 [Enterococcus sp.]|nr:hypothetical protein [Enterococcus sp.]